MINLGNLSPSKLQKQLQVSLLIDHSMHRTNIPKTSILIRISHKLFQDIGQLFLKIAPSSIHKSIKISYNLAQNLSVKKLPANWMMKMRSLSKYNSRLRKIPILLMKWSTYPSREKVKIMKNLTQMNSSSKEIKMNPHSS